MRNQGGAQSSGFGNRAEFQVFKKRDQRVGMTEAHCPNDVAALPSETRR